MKMSDYHTNKHLTETHTHIYTYISWEQHLQYGRAAIATPRWIFDLIYHSSFAHVAHFTVCTWCFFTLPLPRSHLIISSNSTNVEPKNAVSSCIRHSKYNRQEVCLVSLPRLKRCCSMAACSFVICAFTSGSIIEFCCETIIGKTGGCCRNTADLSHARIPQTDRHHTVLWILKQGWDTSSTATGSSVRNFPLHRHSDVQHIFTVLSSWPSWLWGTPINVKHKWSGG